MVIAFAGFTLNVQGRTLSGPDGPIDIGERAIDVLRVLLSKPNDVISKDDLLSGVWGGAIVEENAIQAQISSLRKALGPSMIATVHGRGYRYAGPRPELPGGPGHGVNTGADTRPVIAILPFENLNGDPGQDYFSNGITQDIVDRLTRFRVLSIIGIDLAFVLRGAKPDLEAIRSSFGAGFFVSGTVRRSATQIRIAVRLADAATLKVIWAEHYDRPIVDLFDVQDEVAEMVAATVSRRLEIEITGRTSRRHPANLTSYEQTLLGCWHYLKLTRDDTEAAVACFERALASDPGNWEAAIWLGNARCARYYSDFQHSELLQGVRLLRKAMENDPANARGFGGYSFGVLWSDGIDAARAAVDHALSLNPSEAYCIGQRALVAMYECRNGEATQWLEKGLKLTPFPPVWFAEYAALIAFSEGRYRDAIPGLAAIPDCAWDMMYLISCYGHLGEPEKAQAITQRFAAEGRVYDFFSAAAREPYRLTEPRERLIAGLELALRS